MKIILSILVIVLIGFFASGKTTTISDPYPTLQPLARTIVSIGNAKVEVEIADTPETMALGLGERESLPEGSGMLFVYGRKTPAIFWMKGMRFPLDIIWISDGEVVQIDKGVPQEPGVADENLKRYVSNEPIDMVLEVNAGFADKNDIKVGDSAQMQSYP